MRLADPRSYSAWSRGPFTGALEVGRRLQGSREDRGALALVSRLRSASSLCLPWWDEQECVAGRDGQGSSHLEEARYTQSRFSW